MEYDKNICILGLGYIGLPTASILANKGYKVHGVDVQPDVVETINNGQIHIVEPDLQLKEFKNLSGAKNINQQILDAAGVWG